jgi:hypothetical protein
MAKYEKTIIGQFDTVVKKLENDITNSGISIKVVDESNYSIGDTKIAVRVYDKYFMRNGSRASLSLTVVGSNSDIYISAIGAGGGQGIFLNFSLGAEDDMVRIVEQSIQQMD